MQRHLISPRPDWEAKIQEQGFLYYQDYYNEQVCYSFTAVEVDRLEAATAAIFEMCLAVVQHVIDNSLWDEFFIPRQYAELIKWSWDTDAVSFYGRFDLGYDGENIKLLEFNADTPTSLLEASVIQWFWVQEHDASLDQFNSIHEKLLAHMKRCKEYFPDNLLFFTCARDSTEDFMTVSYLQNVAAQAGIRTDIFFIDDIGLDAKNDFVTQRGEKIQSIFKLYPYEWMFNEEFGSALITSREKCAWIEPPYKAILSNKMLLKYLYKLFPDSPYILPCEWGRPVTASYVKKPVYSREGANITVVKNGTIVASTEGEYGEEGFLFQEYFELPRFDGMVPVIGSWVIAGVPAGIGIRESEGFITGNKSRFCPHYFL